MYKGEGERQPKSEMEKRNEDPGPIVDRFLVGFSANKEMAWKACVGELKQWIANGKDPSLRKKVLLDGIASRIEEFGGRRPPRNLEVKDKKALHWLKEEIRNSL